MNPGDILKSVHDVWGSGSDYELIELLQIGGEAEAWKAGSKGTGAGDSMYFVKNLTNHVPGAPSEDREYFEKQQSEVFEAFAQASGESFVCPPLHFFHNEKPSRYIQVFQWLEGKNLDDLLKSEDLSFVDRRMLANMVAHGLAGIHERGFAIVDLKPENILVQIIDDGKHKKYIGSIIDITSAWKCGYGSEPQGTLPHWMVFTEEWRSPEIFFGQRALDTGKIDRADQLGPYYPDTASDVYIAGLIFYQLFTGGLPLDAKTPKEQRALVARIWNGEGTIAHPCDAGAVGISRDQGDLILRMLAKKKEDRPTMREVHNELAGIQTDPVTPPPPEPPQPPPEPEPPQPPPEPEPPQPPPEPEPPQPPPEPEPQQPGDMTLIGKSMDLTLKQPNGSLDLNPGSVRPLGQAAWDGNIGMVMFYENLGWAIRFNRNKTKGLHIKLDGNPVSDDQERFPLGVGSHSLDINGFCIDLKIAEKDVGP